VGSTVPLRGPLGVFSLPDELNQDVCFVCTGTGIAPFRSMLMDIHRHQRPHQNLYLIFGTRIRQDILYWEEMKRLAGGLPRFQYIVALSRETSPEWTGRKGYVHAVYEELFADKRPAHFFLCGWRNMIDEARQRITALGYDRKNVHVELYG
jgi:CDP-4-dehydro-6-deoxyglucose reductase